uniref:Secreted protein n=1 Tax=Bionectria ochroleuca TaxID=29856 RepID=A0A8H7N1E2_BIOOC
MRLFLPGLVGCLPASVAQLLVTRTELSHNPTLVLFVFYFERGQTRVVRRHFGPLDCLHLIGNTRRDMQAASNMHHCSHLGSEPRTYHFEAGAWTFDYVLNDLHGGQGVHI